MKQIFTHNIDLDGIHFRHTRGSSNILGKEFHIFHEIIYFLGGDAEFISENLHMRPTPGTLIVVPKETYHQMIIHGDPKAYYRCLLQFPDLPDVADSMSRHEGKVAAVKGDDEIAYLFQKLIEIPDTPGKEAGLLLRSLLIVLLNCIQNKKNATDETGHQTEIIRMATHYIDQNLGNRILVSDIATVCNISPSSLSHTFKKAMNISLHKFIVRKRLMAAYHKISAGQPATLSAMECGFHDYSGFYKQYKKMFGFSPSQSQ